MPRCAFCSARTAPVDGRCRYCGMMRSGPSAAWGVPDWASPVELRPVTRSHRPAWLVSFGAIVAVASVVLYLNGAFGKGLGTGSNTAVASNPVKDAIADPLADPGASVTAVVREAAATLDRIVEDGPTTAAASAQATAGRVKQSVQPLESAAKALAPGRIERIKSGVRYTEPNRFAVRLPATPDAPRVGRRRPCRR